MIGMDLEGWHEVWATLRYHKLRTALTAFGVFWGIFMLIVLLAVGKGVEKGASAELSIKNAVFLYSGGGTTIPYAGLSRGRYVRFVDKDVTTLAKRIEKLATVIPANYMGWEDIEYRGTIDSYQVHGAYPETMAQRSLEVVQGRFVNALDIAERRKIAVIGTRVHTILFGEQVEVTGKRVTIGGIAFTIVGVFSSRATRSEIHASPQERIYIPNTTLRSTFNQKDHITDIIITPKPGTSGRRIEEQAVRLLKIRHRVHPNDHAPVRSYNAEERYLEHLELFATIAFFSWLVAIGTIASGAIGVSIIMLIVVRERTREIGIRKALGATPVSIVSMIFQEALVISLGAGYLGLVAGVALMEVAGAELQRLEILGGQFAGPEVSVGAAMAVLTVLVLSSVLAAIAPAMKAASVDPARALQHKG